MVCRLSMHAVCVDYIRQYTWDKRVETGVKSVAMIAGKSLPTVISPQNYKLRLDTNSSYSLLLVSLGLFVLIFVGNCVLIDMVGVLFRFRLAMDRYFMVAPD